MEPWNYKRNSLFASTTKIGQSQAKLFDFAFSRPATVDLAKVAYFRNPTKTCLPLKGL